MGAQCKLVHIMSADVTIIILGNTDTNSTDEFAYELGKRMINKCNGAQHLLAKIAADASNSLVLFLLSDITIFDLIARYCRYFGKQSDDASGNFSKWA